MKFFESTTKAI